jgi:hypothetical protein
MKPFLLFLLFVSAALSQPKISLSPQKSDIGTVYQGDVKNISIIVKNIGNDTLTIMSVQPSCGCTKARAPKPALGAGESDTILISFNSSGFDGPITKHLDVQSNDPETPFADAVFTGTVTSELLSVPEMRILNIGVKPIGETTTASYSFVNNTNRTIALKGFSCTDTNVAVHFPMSTVAASDTVSIDFSITPVTPYFVDDVVYILTDSKRQPRVPVRIGFAGKNKR